MTQASAPSLLHHFRGPAASVTHLAFHPTQNRLASASADHTVQLWSFGPQLRCYRLAAHSGVVHCVRWSPDGRHLASASADGTARLWVPTVRGSSAELRGHLRPVRSVDFNPSGRKVCTASEDRTVKYWSVAHQKLMVTYAKHTNWVRSARISVDGQQIASCSDDRTTKVVDVRSAQEVCEFRETKGSGLEVAWHPQDQLVAVALTQGRVKVYELRTRKLLQLYEVSEEPVAAVAFHRSGDYLLAASGNGETRVLDLLEGRPVYTLLGHAEAVEACAWAPDGARLATGGKDRQIMVWSFTETERDPENCAATLNVSGVESLPASSVANGDNDAGAGAEPDKEAASGSSHSMPATGSKPLGSHRASILVNPRNSVDAYEDDKFEIETIGDPINAFPVPNPRFENSNAEDAQLNAMSLQLRAIRSLADALQLQLRFAELAQSARGAEEQD